MKIQPSKSTAGFNVNVELLAAAVESAKDSIIITDAQLDEPGPSIIYVNQSFTRMTGYAAQEVVGKSPRFLQGPETARHVLDDIRNKLSNGEWFDGKTVNYRKDGSAFINEWHIEPILTDDSQINHFLAIQRDVTESETTRRALEDKNKALHELLQQIEREKQKVRDDILSNIEEVLLPTLSKLRHKSSQLDHEYLTILENNLRELSSSFGRNLIDRSFGLSPREVEIATMIRQGLSTKAIAQILGISERTAENHRNHIRHKMGIRQMSINLSEYLKSL